MMIQRMRLFVVVALIALISLTLSGHAQAAAAEQAVKGAAGAATESAKDTASKAAKGTLATGQKVNINTAKADELATLPGIGPKIADEIIAHREKNGPFKSTEALKEVKGVGDKKYESLKDKITIE